MGLHRTEKLKRLHRELPVGVVAPSSWLAGQGYSRQLVYKYVTNGWLERIGRGAYARPDVPVSWQGVVVGLQRLAKLRLHPGGLTLFEHVATQGQHLRLGSGLHVDLYGQDHLPLWAGEAVPDARFRRVKRHLFDPGSAHLIISEVPGLVWPMHVACLERAFLELLDDVPRRFSFEQADLLMQGLPSLSPRRLNDLLPRCRSIKVRRLFLFFADRHDHLWRPRINSLDLGSGVRQIVAGGSYNTQYQIMVPPAYA